jgi:hypothetical protein
MSPARENFRWLRVAGRAGLGGFWAAGLAAAALAQTPPAPGERDTPDDQPRPHQKADQTPPPKSPADANPDTGAVLPPPVSTPEPPKLETRRVKGTGESAQPPGEFNPDPGAAQKTAVSATDPYFKTDQVPASADPSAAPLPPNQALPRGPLESTRLEETTAAPATPRDGLEPVPADLQLPRAGTRRNEFISNSWSAPESYPSAAPGSGLPPNTKAVPDRWRDAPFYPWRRYTSGDTNELPYFHAQPDLWHYYRQSILKGDLPVSGQDLFLDLTASAELVYEDRKLTLPSGVSSSDAGSFDFFGQSRSQIFASNFALQADLFRGETVFKPVEWLVRLKPVFNFNRLDQRETGVSPDPRGSLGSGSAPPDNSGVTNPGDVGGLLGGGLTSSPGSLNDTNSTNRNKTYVALQEAFVEVHLKDLSDNYDFLAMKAGNQTFNSDFRGFIFNDTNLGLRFFGSADNNRWQYNAALFDMREKDTNSELNTFDRRHQYVVLTNVYRQDFLGWKGYTAQFSLQFNSDQGGTHYDTNGNIVRPAPIGTVQAHHVNVAYLGWAGDGHLGRWNVSHAVYLALGHDDFNGIAGRPENIRADMAALELSYDRDWIRYKASLFYASGDGDAKNGTATGFDSIVDNTNFFGGPFSYFVRQGFNLAGTSVDVKQRFSLLPDLRTSKTEGQANFVNPGLRMGGVGADLDITPKLRAFLNANYVMFDDTDSLKTVLLTNQLARPFGTDLSLGVQWRPWLTENVVISAGYGALLPGRGFRDLYRTAQPTVPGFTTGLNPEVDRWLYSAVLAVNLTY